MRRAIGRIHGILMEHFEVYDNERVFHEDLVKFRKLLFSSQIFVQQLSTNRKQTMIGPINKFPEIITWM